MFTIYSYYVNVTLEVKIMSLLMNNRKRSLAENIDRDAVTVERSGRMTLHPEKLAPEDQLRIINSVLPPNEHITLKEFKDMIPAPALEDNKTSAPRNRGITALFKRLKNAFNF